MLHNDYSHCVKFVEDYYSNINNKTAMIMVEKKIHNHVWFSVGMLQKYI